MRALGFEVRDADHALKIGGVMQSLSCCWSSLASAEGWGAYI